MKKNLLKLLLVTLLCSVAGHAQWSTVSASNITDLNQQKLATGKLCFLGTDQNDRPINFQVGGGGQVLARPFCSTVSNGVVTSFTVPNPASTSPGGVLYRVTVVDSSTGQQVLLYKTVAFLGSTFNFDTYSPPGFFGGISGVVGPLTVTGNMLVTGTLQLGATDASLCRGGSPAFIFVGDGGCNSNGNIFATSFNLQNAAVVINNSSGLIVGSGGGVGSATFNRSSAASVGFNANSVPINISSSVWNGSSAQTDSWLMQVQYISNATNAPSTLSFTAPARANPDGTNHIHYMDMRTDGSPATSGQNTSGPQIRNFGSYWTGSSAATDAWQYGPTLGSGTNPTSTFSITHSGSSGTVTLQIPAFLQIGSAGDAGITNAGAGSGIIEFGNGTFANASAQLWGGEFRARSGGLDVVDIAGASGNTVFGVALNKNVPFSWSSDNTARDPSDTCIYRDAAATIDFGNCSSSTDKSATLKAGGALFSHGNTILDATQANMVDVAPTSSAGSWARSFRVVSAPGSNGQDGGAFGVLGSTTTPTYVYMAIPTADATGFDSTKIVAVKNDGTFIIGATDTGFSRLTANSVGLGNGTAGNATGNLSLGTLNVGAGNLQVNSNGRATVFGGISTVGFAGVPVQIAQTLVSASANVGTTTFFTTGSAATQLYRMCYTGYTQTSGTGTTATFTIGWSTAAGAKSFTTPSIALNATDVTSQTSSCIMARMGTGTALTYAITSGSWGTSAANFQIIVEEMF